MIINKQKLQNIISQGEGLTIEFKKAKNRLPNNLFETVCAFLNKTGGEIILGVDDDKTIVGVDEKVVEQLAKEIANLSNNPQKLFPSFLLEPYIIDYNNKKLIYIFIPISSQVHKTANKIYDRSVDGDFVINSDTQIRQLYTRKSNEYSENRIYPFVSENDFADGIVNRIRNTIRVYRPNHPWNGLSNMDFFKRAGLYRKDINSLNKGFTLSAVLLFGKEEIIHSAVPHYKIDALLRRNDIDRYDDRENIRCNLIESFDKLMAFVEKHLPDKFYLQGIQRISLRDKIFREVVVNMLIHREYTNAFPSTFIIYKDNVILQNANKTNHFGILEIGSYKPFPKNPDIANIFTQMGLSEELGTGIQNVYKYIKPYSGSDNVIFKEEDVFVTIIPLVDTVVDTVVDEKLITTLKLIENNNSISASQIANKLDVSSRTVQRYIKQLKEKNIIIRKGDEKTGYWQIVPS